MMRYEAKRYWEWDLCVFQKPMNFTIEAFEILSVQNFHAGEITMHYDKIFSVEYWKENDENM
jgi:hypothetical protein